MGPQEISTLASEFQELQDAAGQWRRGNTVHLQMPMTTRQQEATVAVGWWLLDIFFNGGCMWLFDIV